MENNRPSLEDKIQLCGQLLALLEHRAHLHGSIVELYMYFQRGLHPQLTFPQLVGRDLRTVQPHLTATGRDQPHLNTLNKIVQKLQADQPEETRTPYYVTWARALSSIKNQPRPELPSINMGQIFLYTQGYLDQRRELDPTRPPPPDPFQTRLYHWHYYAGRLISYRIAASHPDRTPAELLAIADSQELGNVLR